MNTPTWSLISKFRFGFHSPPGIGTKKLPDAISQIPSTVSGSSYCGDDMARLNVEEKIWADQRFLDLCLLLKSRALAIGSLVCAWRVSQQLYKQNVLTISIEDWKKNRLPDELIQVGLAELQDGGVYVCGTKEYFSWINSFKERGKLGGIASSSKRLANAKLMHSKSTLKLKQIQPSLLSSPSSLLSSQNTNTIAQQVERDSQSFDFEIVYQRYPKKVGKQRGLSIAKKQIRSLADFESLQLAIENYKKYLEEQKTEPQFIKHFSTFMGSWRDWLSPEAGRAQDFSGEKIDWAAMKERVGAV